MNRNYDDILRRISTPPLWFDEQAVPRFDAFHPSMLDVYADEAALVLIRCQNCDHEFLVAFCDDRTSRAVDGHLHKREGRPSIAERIAKNALEYNDPPNIDCCAAGPTMNSIPVRVVEYWHKNRGLRLRWEREPSAEVALRCAWAEEEDAS